MEIMDEIFVKFQGFRPTQLTRSYLRWIVRELYDLSPYGARIQASFSRTAKEIKGTIQIISPAGTFVAYATGEQVKEVSKNLREELKRQLKNWKTLRFEATV